MRKLLPISLILLLLTGCSKQLVSGPRGFWKSNRFDRLGNQTGRWNVYYDSACIRPFTKGCYRHGTAVKCWRYYNPLGVLEREEHYHKKGRSELTYYYPNGKVARKGQARMVNEPDGMHFYWFGKWPVYYLQGGLQKVEIYSEGKLVSTRAVAP